MRFASTAHLDPRLTSAFASAEGNRFPLEGHLLAAVVMGSTAQNTVIRDGQEALRADFDLRAIVLPPRDHLLGLEQWRGGKNVWTWKGEYPDADFDVEVHAVAKVMEQLLKGSPSFLEWLWARPEDTLATGALWQRLVAHRHLFVTQEAVRRFQGFAAGQLARMNTSGIAKYEGEHKYQELRDRVAALGLDPDAAIAGPVIVRLETTLSAAWREERLAEVQSLAGLLRQVHAARAQVFAAPEQYTTLHMGAKRKARVDLLGYDTKNAMHLVRLLRMAREMALTGEVRLWRTEDAEELRAIKRGDWALDDVRAEGARLHQEVDAALTRSALPPRADRRQASMLLESLYLDAYALDPEQRAPSDASHGPAAGHQAVAPTPARRR